MTPTDLTDNEQDQYNERIAIVMEIKGMTIHEAERIAREGIERKRKLF